jgi:hypothetical protein
MDPGPTISRPYTRHKWVGRMICSQAIVSACAQDPIRLPESMTIIKNRTDNLRFSFPLLKIGRSYNIQGNGMTTILDGQFEPKQMLLPGDLPTSSNKEKNGTSYVLPLFFHPC